MDDNDNRLFGVTAEIALTPEPAYRFMVRTPLYAVSAISHFLVLKPSYDVGVGFGSGAAFFGTEVPRRTL
jgi:hypothetical protein